MRQITILLTALLGSLAIASFAAAQTYGGSMDTLQGALEYNPINQPSTWVNPDTGDSGTVTPVRTFANGQRQPCREFQQTIVIGGREERGYGTACRQPDGSWQIVSGQPAAATRTVEQRSTVYVREVPRPYPYYSSYYNPYAYPYAPYGYYNPWGYAYPYWFPFNVSLNLGYVYSSGKYYKGHSHGGHYYKGHSHGGHYYKGHSRGGHSSKWGSFKGHKGRGGGYHRR